MNEAEKKIAKSLFQTEALTVAPADHPFWYTSGTLGLYFINTHYLFGGKQKADELLALIDEALKGDRLELPSLVGGACLAHYEQGANGKNGEITDSVGKFEKSGKNEKFGKDENGSNVEKDRSFRDLMDYALTRIGNSGTNYDAISGGERRDFYFSYVLAEKAGVPHVTLFKDNSAVVTDPGFRNARWLGAGDLQGMRVLHVADLVTEASSYVRYWLSALHNFGAEISETLAVVDRKQGGKEILANEGVDLIALITLDQDFFAEAVATGHISATQRDGILAFQKDPHGYMRDFLTSHPNFIATELAAGGKAAERAQRAIDNGFV